MVIYRKYRPQKFSEIIGQEHIIKILESEIKQNKVAHAYLFTGSRGLGKTTTARILAKALNCEKRKNGESEPCNECPSCQATTKGLSFDLIELDAASQTGVDNVRENIIAYSRIPPAKNKYKVFVIDECHMLSLSAFNALLKTLEEPPPYVIFILATTEIHKLPETIISRCQRFDFTRVPAEKIIERLKKIAVSEKVKIDEQILKIIAYRSEGCVRDAESLFNQILALDGEEITLEEASLVLPPTQTTSIIEFLDLILSAKARPLADKGGSVHERSEMSGKKEVNGAINLINKLLNEGIDLEQFTADLIEFLRKVILIKVGVMTSHQEEDAIQNKMKEFANSTDLKILVSITEEFIKTKIQFTYSEIPQLPLELTVIKICEK